MLELSVDQAGLTAGMARARVTTDRESMAMQRTVSARMKTAGTSLTSFGQSWNRHVALPIAGLGALALKSSLDFHHAMMQVSEQAGASTREVAKLNGQVLALARHSIFSPKQLADALFHIESVGFRGARAMLVLNAAQKLATVGNSDLATTTYALVSAQDTHIKGTEKLTKTIGSLNAIVGAGDMHMEDLTAAMSSGVLVAAKNVGISLNDVGAALDVMTKRGMPAEESATRLRMTLSLMAAPTRAAQRALASVGLSADDLANTMRAKGLPAAVQQLADHLSRLSKTDANMVLARAFGGGRSSAAIMTLVQNVDDLHGRLRAIDKTAGDFKDKLREAENEPINRLKTAWSSVQASLVQIGDVLLPAAVPAFEHIASAATAVGDAFVALPKPMRSAVVDAALIAGSLGVAARAGGLLLRTAGSLSALKVGTTVAAEVASGSAASGGAEYLAARSLGRQGGPAGMLGITSQAASRLYQQPNVGVIGARELGASAATIATPETFAARYGNVAGARYAMPVSQLGAESTSMVKSLGSSLSSGLATAMRYAIPGAIAAAGFGDALSSAVRGDTKQALWKSGGMLAGGLVGGLVGGVPGALMGSGLGSMVGGLLGNVLDPQKSGYGFADRWAEAVGERLNRQFVNGQITKRAGQKAIADLTLLDRQLSSASRAFDGATAAQLSASRALAHSSDAVVTARQRQQRATASVSRAESALAAARRRYPAESAPVVSAEARVIEAKNRDIRATNALKNAERLHGVELQAAKITTVAAYNANRTLVSSLQAKLKATEASTAQDVKDIHTKGMSADRLRALQQDNGAYVRTLQQLGDAQKKGIEIAAKAAQQIGPKFAQQLKQPQNSIDQFGTSTIRAVRLMDRLSQQFPHASVTMSEFGRVTVRIKRGMDDMAGAFPAAARKARPGTDQLTSNFAGFANSVYQGETTTVSNLNKGLAAFGVRPVHFSLAKPTAHRQTGGMVVPGTGTGDKVHLQAMVEPGEVIHVLNMRAARDRRKLAALDRINSDTPRFQGGGWTAGLQPGIIAATNALLSHFPGLSVTSALRSSMPMGHPDFHNTGQATDTSGAPDLMLKAAQWISSSGLAARLTEGIHNPNLSVKYGKPVSPGFWGSSTWAAHLNHIHMAVVGALGSFTGAAADHVARILLRGPTGPLRSLGQGIEDRLTKGANRYLSAHMPAVASTMETGPAGMTGPGRVAGRVSTFGPPGEAAGTTASGLSDSRPGIALNIAPGTDAGWNNPTTRSWVQARQPFDVAIGSHHGVLPVIDEGPAGSTGRAIDVTGAGAHLLGIDPSNFPTDSYGVATLVRRQLGGLIRLATGGTLGGNRKNGTRAALAKARQRVATRRPKHKARKITPHHDTIADALSPFLLSASDALAPLKVTVGELTGRLDGLSNQEGLLGTLAGQDSNAFVLGADMPFLSPTLQSGENIFAGMDLPSARRAYDHAVSLADGNTSPELDLQGQLLDWIGSQADHQLLTPETTSIIASTFGPAALGFSPGTTIPAAQIQNLAAQINAMHGQAAVEKAATRVVNRAIAERTQRRRLVERLALAAKKRLDGINRDLDNLTSGSLKKRLAAAKDKGARSQRIHNAEAERGHLSDLIANERSNMKPDQAAIRGWEQRVRDINSFIRSERQPASSVDAAQAAILRHNLETERRSVEGELAQLGGTSTKVGTGGMLGTISGQVTTLTDGRTTMEADIARLVQTDIPTAKLELLAIQQSLPEGERPTISTDAAAADNTQLADLLTQQLQDTQTKLLVAQAQSPVFQQFIDMFPKFHTGGILGGGPAGAERMYVGRVGEGVFTPEQMASMAPAGGDGAYFDIHHHYAPGMGWLRDFVNTEVKDHLGRTISKARRRTTGAPA